MVKVRACNVERLFHRQVRFQAANIERLGCLRVRRFLRFVVLRGSADVP